MQQKAPALDYAGPPRERGAALRRVSGRIVIGAWALLAVTFVLHRLSSSAGGVPQWRVAVFGWLCIVAAVGLTLAHWLVLVPVVSFRTRREERRRLNQSAVPNGR